MDDLTQTDTIVSDEQPIVVTQNSGMLPETLTFDSIAIEYVDNKLKTFSIDDINRCNHTKAKMLFQNITRVNKEAGRYLLWKIGKLCKYAAARCISESTQFESYKSLVLIELNNDNNIYSFSQAVDGILVSVLFNDQCLFDDCITKLNYMHKLCDNKKRSKQYMSPSDFSSHQMSRFLDGPKEKTIYWNGIVNLITTEIKNDRETLKLIEFSAFTDGALLKEVLECSDLNIIVNSKSSIPYMQLIDKLCITRRVYEASIIILKLGIASYIKFCGSTLSELEKTCLQINNEYHQYYFNMYIAIEKQKEDEYALKKFRDKLFPKLSSGKSLVSIYCMSVLYEIIKKGSIFYGFAKECERFASYIPENFNPPLELFKLIIQCQDICTNLGKNVVEFLSSITCINVCRLGNTRPINRNLRDYAEGLRVPSSKHIENMVSVYMPFTDICFIYFNSYLKLGYGLQRFCLFCIEHGISIFDINTAFSRFTLTGALKAIEGSSILVRFMNINAEYIWGSSSAILCELNDLRGKLLSFNIIIDSTIGKPQLFAYNVDMYSDEPQVNLHSNKNPYTLINLDHLSRLYKKLAEKTHVSPKIYEEIRAFQIGDIFDESVTMPKKQLMDAIWIRRSQPQAIIHLIKGISLRNPFCAKRIPVNNQDELPTDDNMLSKKDQELANSLARNKASLSDAVFIYINTHIKIHIEFLHFLQDCHDHHRNNLEDKNIICHMYSCGIVKEQHNSEFIFYPEDFFINDKIIMPYNLYKFKSIYCDVPIIAQLSINVQKDKVFILVIDVFDEVSYFASDAYWEMCYSAIICATD